MWKYLIICMLCLCSRTAHAAPDTSRMLHFNMKNGFPSNHAYYVMQDRNGYWWICTDNGLVKYNGYSFRVFNTNDGLPGNDIFACYEDSRRRLWLQCHTYRLGYLKDNVYRRTQPFSTRAMVITTKYYEHDHYVYFSYADSMNRLVRIDTNDRVKVFNDPLRVLVHYNNFYIRMNGSLLQKCLVVGDSVEITPVCRKSVLPDTTFSGLTQYLNNRAFNYRFMGSSFNITNLKTCRQEQYELGGYDGTESGRIYLGLSRGNTMQIFSEHYVYILDTAFRVRQKLRIADIIPHPVQVSNYFTDSAGHAWYGTVSDGVWVQTGTGSVFSKGSLLKDIEGDALAGTIKNGMSFWWNSDKKMMTVLSPGFKTMWRQVFTEDLKFVSDAGDSMVYLCFSNSNLNSLGLYDLQTKLLRNIATEKATLAMLGASNKINLYTGTERQMALGGFFNIQQYHTDTMFGSTRISTISMITKDSNRVFVREFTADRYPYFFNDTANKRYWFYNEEKVACFDPSARQAVIADRKMLGVLGISSVRQITADRYGNVFAIAGNKLLIYNPRMGRLRYMLTNFNLAGVFIQVHDSTLLLGGKFGIACATLRGPMALGSFRILPNLKGRYYNRMYHLMVNAAGNIIVNTDIGAYSFTMAELFSDASLIENKNKQFMQLVAAYPEQHAVRTADSFYLPQTTDRINFDLLNIYGSGTPQYSYRIGDRQNWQQSQAGEVYLAGMDPGKYYRVQCMAYDDVWKSNLYTFYIYKKPYWYQTSTWFGIFWVSGTLLFVILLLGVILLTRNIVARANDKKRLLTELELRAIYSQINPHFIFNTLGTALFFINKKSMDEAYQHVSKFSRLLRSYLRSSRNRYITLADELEMIRNYIELQQIRFENKFSYHIEVENKIPVNSVQIPSLLLQPLVENAITHGLFHMPKEQEGLLVLSFLQGSSSNELICTIEDNGVGRDKAKEIKKDSVVQYESYGTALTKELIDIFRQYENMNILLEYIDKTPPDSGTIVKLTIKNLKYVA